jgi:NADPH:quinone reductase-like Zn-dependent oxidoreductase
MRAVRTTAAVPPVALVEGPDPDPLPNEVLVGVRTFSLNRGEVLDLVEARKGAPVGWDFAGVVVRAAEDESGPAVGARVAGIVRRGAWAELVAAPTSQVATVPDNVRDAEAATLPTAGLTALRALELAGSLLARRVLITGASGGVGQYAVQLATLGGATVTALVRDVEAAGEMLRRLGAADVAADVSGYFDVVVDAVGGATFATAIEHVAPRGNVVNLATGSADEVVSFRARRFDRSAGARIHTFNLLDEVEQPATATDLARLARLLEQRKLVAPIGLEVSWQEIDRAIEALLARTVVGKVVLHVPNPEDTG